ncbi:Uncharacterized membrane protein YsdA, DUF1294 family [Flavobacterium glycines]|uniref:Uncharacterized membrane protein YsdA, DUF1294 family n=1 Tax=Flavobacterium glycines TaxID=551990 RepID=A0A511CCJ7_9FLAO|nr:DUF1294 domain-containing protein [Flavobacterium glycines]GEL10381.1 hypothetical protein FGL01_11200 [Flavobacterium glycines]SDI70431.1 Uncharacterized membrane protein YsdA, DUF1294 family [Flavobacterium glycines]
MAKILSLTFYYLSIMLLFYRFLILNLIAFILIGYDKYLAKNNKHRIPERTLLSFTLFGGTIGLGLAMLIFSHKTSKRSYLLKFWLIVIIQITLIYIYFNFLQNKI